MDHPHSFSVGDAVRIQMPNDAIVPQPTPEEIQANRAALLLVLTGGLPGTQFAMHSWLSPCRTVGCIGGHYQATTGLPFSAQAASLDLSCDQWDEITCPNGYEDADVSIDTARHVVETVLTQNLSPSEIRTLWRTFI